MFSLYIFATTTVKFYIESFFTERNRLNKNDINHRRRLQLYLQKYLRQFSGDKQVAVHSFGSTCNGFGFRESDLDFYISGMKFESAAVMFKRINLFLLLLWSA